MGEELPHTDIKHRRLSSLTPDEKADVQALLSLINARAQDLEEDGTNHVTLNVAKPPYAANVLRVPMTATVNELVGWALLLARPPNVPPAPPAAPTNPVVASDV
jgi:hypothetical protein